MKSRFAFHDPVFLAVCAVLAGGGLFLLSSASVGYSDKIYGTISHFTIRQALSLLIGLGVFSILQAIPYRLWKRMGLLFLISAPFLLAAVFIPSIGLSLNGARRWIHLGSVTIQPSEIAKLALIIGLAWWFDRSSGTVTSYRYGFWPFLGIMAAVGMLVALEPDIGTLLVMFAGAFLMFLVGGARSTQVIILLLLVAIVVGSLAYVAPYRWQRLMVFLNPAADPQGSGYQARQATIAIGSGGFWGAGYGASQQKYSYLPEPIGDSIFAIVAEEFGLLGSAGLVALFLFFLWRGIVIARNAPDIFSKLLVTGIIATIVLQAFLNIGAISGLFPLTGVPLPFISYGGTSLVVTLAGLGIVYQVAKHS